jgi:hypothetical protein
MFGDEDRPTGTSGEPTGTTGDEPAGGSGANEGGSVAGDANVAQELEAAKAELENERRKNAQLLSQKTKWEQGAPGTQPPPTMAPGATPGYDVDSKLAETVAAAQAGDVVAEMTLRGMQLNEYRIAEIRRDMALDRIPDADERQKVRELYDSRAFGTVEAAHDAYLGRLYRDRKSKLDQLETQLKAEAEARREGVVSTATRPMGPGETRARTMTFSDYTAKMQQLPIDEKRKLIKDREAGKITLTD